ncbi:energy transducer TonB [Salidesulfovibrio brasiliensis]|uniref:energy transducer TonB n=1 Tax=Salidesulfovibrio brasiliensis TaxID=221711 RepID=UPI0009F8A1ED|nr:energy transducer TonB [Salidesulfovibrio brasiliensis]
MKRRWARGALVITAAVAINTGLLIVISLLCLKPQNTPIMPPRTPVDLVFSAAPEPKPEEEPTPVPDPPEEYQAPSPKPQPKPTPAPPPPTVTPDPDAAVTPQPSAEPVQPASHKVQDAFYELAQVDESPRPIHQPPPVYPKSARRRRITGLVELRFLVETDGRVKRIVILSSEPKEIFDEAARQAVGRWRFSPGKVQGRAVRTWMRIPIRFQLR